MPINRKELEFYDAKSAKALADSTGETIVIELEPTGTDIIRFGIPIESARSLLHQLTHLVSATLKDQNPLGGTGFVKMTPVTSARAQATDGDGLVALGLVDELEIPHYYTLQAQTSAQLRPQLRTAEEHAKRGVRLPKA